MKSRLLALIVGLVVGGAAWGPLTATAQPRRQACRELQSAVAVVVDHAEFALAFHRELVTRLGFREPRWALRNDIWFVLNWEQTESPAFDEAIRLAAECAR